MPGRKVNSKFTVANMVCGKDEDVKRITVKICDELHQRLADDAFEQNVPLGEIAARMIARGYGKPELGAIPRKLMGRPRKAILNGSAK